MRSMLILAGLVATLPATAHAQTTRLSASDPTEIRTLLTHPSTSRGNGTVAPVDAMLAAIVDGTWVPPRAGKDNWHELASAADGRFESDDLAGGWAFATVEADAAAVALLRAAGHTMVYVNGEPRAGDVYSAGFLALPVQLHKGTNTLLFQGGRGELRAKLTPTKGSTALLDADMTLPDLVEGGTLPQSLAVVIANLTDQPRAVTPTAHIAGAAESHLPTAPTIIPPFSIRKVPIMLPAFPGHAGDKVACEITEGDSHLTHTFTILSPDAMRKVTFTSDIDGSLQYYALRPATGGSPTTRPAMVLSLHGASVEATNQANAYASKSWAHIVCPTNRRPYGFDWEDWGRLDALEVLHDAEATLPYDTACVYLTGHSMGGHGTWHLGVNLPGTFAAIGPSAGWVSFASYASARSATRPATSATSRSTLATFRAASVAGDTLALRENLADTGIYILHGDADDNVPIAQARAMVEALRPFHHDFQIHEQKGAGHWWSEGDEPGARCVDYPGMFDFFARHRLPTDAEVRDVKFSTASPGICSKVHWATIAQQAESGQYSSVDLHAEPHLRRFTGTTKNVSALTLDPVALAAGDGDIRLALDGSDLAVGRAEAFTVWRTPQGDWRSGPPVPVGEKNPARCGPLKAALAQQMIFVYGTHGTPEENRLSYLKARYDSEGWHYRANGAVNVVADTDRAPFDYPDRTLALYGNADVNSAWQFIDPRCPIHARRERIELGGRVLEGDCTAIFCYPRNGSHVANIVAFAPTTPRASRASQRLPIFTSGIGWPDYVVISADLYKDGPRSIQSAGFFDQGWALPGVALAPTTQP